MKRTVIVALISAVITTLIVLTIFEIVAQVDQLDADEYEVIESKMLEEDRKLLIHLPRNYDKERQYHVMYVLDGSSQDFRVAGLAEVLAAAEVVPEFIVVGIPNTNRNRDLTPPYILQDSEGEEYGKADLFLKFLIEEVRPLIEGKYPVSGHNSLLGHSRAGLFSFYAMLENSGFDSYFCISPALWRDNRLILEMGNEWISSYNADNAFLYMSMGEEENEKMKGAYDDALGMLRKGNLQGLQIEDSYTPKANHGNNLYYSVPKALVRWALTLP